MLVFIVAYAWLLVERVKAADPDPLIDFSTNATTPVFLNMFANGDVPTGSGGIREALDIGKFPCVTYADSNNTSFLAVLHIRCTWTMSNGKSVVIEQIFVFCQVGTCRSEGLTVVQFKRIPCGENVPHPPACYRVTFIVQWWSSLGWFRRHERFWSFESDSEYHRSLAGLSCSLREVMLIQFLTHHFSTNSL